MKKLNLKRIYLKNLNSFLLALYNPFLDSLNRLFKHVNSLITLMFVQCFSIIVKLGENFTTISQRLSWLFACIFYIHDGSAACSLINNNWRYFYSTSGSCNLHSLRSIHYKRDGNKVNNLKSCKEIKFVKPSEGNCFKDEDINIEYVRTFGKWKCLNCNNKWYSAYTWISLIFALKNNKLCRDTRWDDLDDSKKEILVFSGDKLLNKDFLLEQCKDCSDSKVKIISYSNLEVKENDNSPDNREPHRADLCYKCKKGFPCKKSSPTLSNLNCKRYFSSIHFRRNFSSSLPFFSYGKKPIGFNKKNNITNVYFSYDNIIDYDYFKNKMINHVNPGNKYAFLTKVQREDGLWGMGSGHKIVLFSSDNLLNEIKQLHKELVDIIEEYIENYDYCGLNLIQIMILNVERLPDLELKNINELKLDKNLIKLGETRRYFNENVLPITMNRYYYGKMIVNKVQIDIFMKTVYDDSKLNFLKKDSTIVNTDEYKTNKIDIYEYINKRNKMNIIAIMELEADKHVIEVFDNEGKYKLKAFDTKIGDNEFKREIGKITLYIKENHIYKYEIKDKLPVIKPNKPSLESTRNVNIGSFDVETYFNASDNKSYVYALGYKTLGGEKVMFYKLKNESSNELIIRCIDSMFVRKYKSFTFFVHNLSGFDVVFILKALEDYNRDNEVKYIFKPVFRDHRIIKLSVSIRTKSGTIKISFVDSYNLLPKKLKDLSKDFECEVIKGEFSHSFVNESTLYYIGNTPDIGYFNSDLSQEEYNLMRKKDWNLKEEALCYLGKDLDSLLEIMDKFNKYIFTTYDIQITDSLTISRLGMNIILSKYLDDSKIPLITSPTIWNFIKKGYYGGISEVYKAFVEKSYYYDVNSEYPFVAKNKLPSNKYRYIEDYTEKGLNLDELFGFFYCKVKTNNSYLGLLPVHIKGSLILPHGEFYGVWFSEELKLARDNGYQIKVIKGYDFEAEHNVFTKFVDDLYKIRLKSTGMIKSITKLILNAPFGRLGMSIHKAKHDIVDKNRLDLILSTHVVFSLISLNENRYIVSYSSEISQTICENSGLDYIKVLEDLNIDIETQQKTADVSITTAAAITAYGRIHINRIKLLILSLGGKLYYSDTDSVVTDIELPQEMIGKNLGQLKLEHNLKKGYFITSKTYLLETDKDEIIKKAKGFFSDSLSQCDYEEMYFNKKDILAKKGNTHIDYEIGTVNIKDKDAILHYNAYTKRKKLYSDDNLWIDTRPLEYYNNIE